MSLIDTYQIAACGQNTDQTCTMASNGVLLCVTIEPVIPVPGVGGSGGYIHGGLARNKRRDHEERNRKDYRHRDEHKKELEKQEEECEAKRITVIATIDGVEYKETKIVECDPELTVDNIKVDILEESNKPKINIRVILND